MKRILLIVMMATLLPTISLAGVDSKTCQPFYQALEKVPHESIFQREGAYNSRLFQTTAVGCFLVMNTSKERLGEEKIPDLSGEPGTRLYDIGWRVNTKYAAGGPGTSVTGLEKEEALCIVYYDSPTYLNDDGKIAGGEFIKIQVECMAGPQGSSQKMMLREKR